MSESNRVLLIDEYRSSPLKLVESMPTPTGPYTNAVIATLFGVLSDYGHETRNDRWYTGSLWRRVFNDELFKEALDTKTLFGEPDHPLDIENRLETHIPYVSHIIRDPYIDEAKQCVMGYLDILDTPYGRIIKTLIDYGCQLGVSSRGSGDLTSMDGRILVDENTYTFITWDIVARPSNKKARVNEIDTVNAAGKTAFESLKEQINSMIDNHDTASLKLSESLISNTGIPDKDDLLKVIRESIEDNPENQDHPDYQSDLDDAYERILDLKSENSKLDNENKSLRKSLEESENTISDLNGLNKNLSSMVASYMEQLSDKNNRTTIKENDTSDDKSNEVVEPEDEIDFSEVLDAIDQSNNKMLKKLSEMMRLFNQSSKIDDLTKTNESLKEQLLESNRRNTELQTKLKNSQNENTRLIRQTSSVVNEYFKLRCSQLGLNEQVVRKEFNNRLYEYDLKDIDEVLREMYSNGSVSNPSRMIKESNSGKVGSLQLTGSIRRKNNTSESDSDEDLDSELIESIRQVKSN